MMMADKDYSRLRVEQAAFDSSERPVPDPGLASYPLDCTVSSDKSVTADASVTLPRGDRLTATATQTLEGEISGEVTVQRPGQNPQTIPVDPEHVSGKKAMQALKIGRRMIADCQKQIAGRPSI
jgi:hypothetical protein